MKDWILMIGTRVGCSESICGVDAIPEMIDVLCLSLVTAYSNTFVSLYVLVCVVCVDLGYMVCLFLVSKG